MKDQGMDPVKPFTFNADPDYFDFVSNLPDYFDFVFNFVYMIIWSCYQP